MKPIHHSKLKKGDLVLYHSLLMGCDGNFIIQLIEITNAFDEGYCYRTETKDEYCESGTWDYLFLIERGYFL